ncbi:hypothetical protein CK203_072762 [Vitis vinifera]|uniref:DUF4283 domain-containing protein n=1 Tax=Vitis vinifera TaxID=29760 RepID=A0A438EZ01_VITVI|nr:hypothetical protein CK203_072762 [Vitis vinifera]
MEKSDGSRTRTGTQRALSSQGLGQVVLGKGGRLEKLGDPNGKVVGLKGNLGLAKLENGKVLLEFKVMTEAEKALKVGEVSVGGYPEQDRGGVWGVLDIDAKTERMEELQWARILVKINDEKIPNTTEERGKPFKAIGEVEGEVLPREGKRVMEAEGAQGSRTRRNLPMGRRGRQASRGDPWTFWRACWVAFRAPGSGESAGRAHQAGPLGGASKLHDGLWA